jgi:drug/metabolite transporter (DMT)-like permease
VNSTAYGMALALGASFTFSLMNALAKAVSHDMPSPEIAFFRGIFGLVVTVTMMLRAGVSFRGKRPGVLAVRGLLGGLSLLANFATLSFIPLADATLIAHTSPLFVLVLAHFVLKEKLPKAFYAVFAVAIVGSLLVIKPGMEFLHSQWSLIGLLGAMIGAGASISIRSLSKDHDTYIIMLYFMGAAALVPLPFIASFVWPSPKDWVMLFGLGTVSFAGQYLLTKAYSYKEAAVVALTRYAGILFNIGLGFLCFQEIPDGWSLLGGALILAACIQASRSPST